MADLTEQQIIKIMQEEWSSKLHRLEEGLDAFLNEDKGIISKGTKVRHKGSQLLYTVVSVGPRDVTVRATEGEGDWVAGGESVTLKAPEGDLFVIPAGEFESEYELD